MGTFGESALKKWHFGRPNKNLETIFTSPTFHKNDEIVFGFKRFPLLGGLWAYFQISFFPLYFFFTASIFIFNEQFDMGVEWPLLIKF